MTGKRDGKDLGWVGNWTGREWSAWKRDGTGNSSGLGEHLCTLRPGLRALLAFSWFPGHTFHFLRQKSQKIGEIDSAKSSTRMYEEEGQKC